MSELSKARLSRFPKDFERWLLIAGLGVPVWYDQSYIVSLVRGPKVRTIIGSAHWMIEFYDLRLLDAYCWYTIIKEGMQKII